MAKKDRFDMSEENKSFENKKRRKSVVLPFILCLLIAMVIWLYASAKDEKDHAEHTPLEASLATEVDGIDGV